MRSFREFLEAKGWWEDPEHVWFGDENMSKLLQRQDPDAYNQMVRTKNDLMARQIAAQQADPNDPDRTGVWKGRPAQQPTQGPTLEPETEIYPKKVQIHQRDSEVPTDRLAALEKRTVSDISSLRRRMGQLEKAFRDAEARMSSIRQAAA
jgi:hypothetical protein